MFYEEHPAGKNRRGGIEVITGPMFSGKTEELIRRLRRSQIAKLRVEIFKPTTDTRYDPTSIVSHDLNSIHSTPVSNSSAILLYGSNVDVVGIDEAQFFDDGLPSVCEKLASKGIRVIAAGLDMDYLVLPFGPIPELMAVEEFVTKVQAVCVRCGAGASHSFRLVNSEEKVLLGEKESYEPRCRVCFNRSK